jgi:hypothetical protein
VSTTVSQQLKLSRLGLLAIIGLAGLLTTSLLTILLTQASATCQAIIVPAYFSPGSIWDTGVANHGSGTVMIANPNNGPGGSKNTSYASAITKAKTAGVKVAGYVYTSYGSRASATVKADIASWKSYYGVVDIFFDEAPTSTAQLSYYQDLVSTVHASGGQAILNPGTVPNEAFMKVGDIVTTFEGSQSDYQSYKSPSWEGSYPASKYLHLVYGVGSQSAMQTVISQARSRNAGNVYITNDTLSNPWDTLPSYWAAEVTAASQGCSPSTTSSADINHDGTINITDLSILLANFGKTGAGVPGDINADGSVGIRDLSMLLASWSS